ncbi:MAG: hypothetical protein ACYSUU_07435 [Planctomycetota bacterium]|jgi:hypothetical protein
MSVPWNRRRLLRRDAGEADSGVRKPKIGEYPMLAFQLFQFSAHRRRLVMLTSLTFMAMC